MIHNPNCDGNHCRISSGEVRVLPLNKADSSNLILCRSCYVHELAFRVDRNKDLADSCKYDLPSWSDLKVYNNS